MGRFLLRIESHPGGSFWADQDTFVCLLKLCQTKIGQQEHKSCIILLLGTQNMFSVVARAVNARKGSRPVGNHQDSSCKERQKQNAGALVMGARDKLAKAHQCNGLDVLLICGAQIARGLGRLLSTGFLLLLLQFKA